LREKAMGNARYMGLLSKKTPENSILMAYTWYPIRQKNGFIGQGIYAYCCAKFHHDPIKSDDIEEQILQFCTFREGDWVTRHS
jgi:hypothetical protein